MGFLKNNEIVYGSYPSDEPTETYSWGWFYENGTSDYYSLFSPNSIITSLKSLRWHFIVLKYLNPDITEDMFIRLCKHIVKPDNGFVNFNLNEDQLIETAEFVYYLELENPPANRIKKIIFKDGCGLDPVEKLRISGQLMGRNKEASASDIYESMLYINNLKQKITITKIAKHLDVVPRTVYRNMNDTLKKEKQELNNSLKYETLQCQKLHKV